MKETVIILSVMMLWAGAAEAQRFGQLEELKDYPVKVHYSAGHEVRALSIAGRLYKAINYCQTLLAFKPEVTVLVLSAADWSNFTRFPVYGMPHYSDERTLILAAEDNAYWKSFVPPLEQLPEDLRQQFVKVYRRQDGSLSMQAFFDLLAIHELGHAFHMQAGLTTQKKWMGELFVNILLHTYIAENEPEQLSALKLFPEMVIGAGTTGLKYTSLKDLEERYEEIAKQYPKNYGWYQCRWHSSAANIYDADGKQVLVNLWKALKEQKEILNDDSLISFLEAKVHTKVAEVMRNWDVEVKK